MLVYEGAKIELPGGESNPALARPVRMTGACTNPIYYQGLIRPCENDFDNQPLGFPGQLLLPGVCASTVWSITFQHGI